MLINIESTVIEGKKRGSLTKRGWMTHKKYTYKDGKKYGPYLYETKRVDGKIITTYLGQAHSRKKNHRVLAFFGIAILSVLLLILFTFPFFLTGKITLDLKTNYIEGEQIDGALRLNLKEGELLPANSKVIIEYDNVVKEFTLSELIGSDISLEEGDFYAENSGVSGNGVGYGVVGTREVYPEVSFDLVILSPGSDSEAVDQPEEPNTIIGPDEEVKTDESVAEDNQEVIEEDQEQDNTEDQGSSDEEGLESDGSESSDFGESPSDLSPSVSPGITGGVISDFSEGYITTERVRKGENFEHPLNWGEDADIMEGSVKSNGEEIGDDKIELEIIDRKVIVSTDYSVEEEGFGQEYLGDSVLRLDVDIGKFGFIATNSSTFKILLAHEGQRIVEVSRDLAVTPEPEVSIVPPNDTTTVAPIVPNVTIDLNVSAEINTTQYGAVLGEPVRWTKKIVLDKPSEVSIELPASAENISIVNIVKESKESSDTMSDLEEDTTTEDNVDEEIEAPEDAEVNNNSEIVPEETDVDTEENVVSVPEVIVESDGSLITGAVTADFEFEKEFSFSKFIKRIFRFTGFVTIEGEEIVDDSIYFEIDEPITEVEVEYYTDSPSISSEEELANGKIIRVTSPDDVHYEKVLLFTNLSESFGIERAEDIQIFWEEGTAYLNVERFENNIVYWVAPHLSNQTFRIIVIVNAEHLDVNREFISNIYKDVYQLDGNWSEIINDGEFVRVRFEKNLSSENDITIYPRAANDTDISNVRIEVYELNDTNVIAEFESLNEHEYNKIYLSELEDFQDSFDLRILGGAVEFDHIIDPVPSLTISTYNFSGITNPSATHKVFWASPAGRNVFLAGTEASTNQYRNMSTPNASVSSVQADASNDEPFWRITFDIAETSSSVSWIFVNYTGFENAAEAATAYAFNFTGNSLATIGTIPGSNGVISRNFTDGINFVNATNGDVYIYAEGANYDTGDYVHVDFVGLKVAYTPADTLIPIVTLNLPANTTYNSLPINFNISTDESSVANYSLNNGLTNYTMTSAGGTSFNGTNYSISDGQYIARFFAQDTLGNLNSTTNVTFSVGVSPLVNITLPINTTYNTTPLYFNISLNENGTAWFSLNNGLNNYTMTGNESLNFGTVFNATNSSIADGSYVFRAFANDTAGNINYTVNVTFSFAAVDVTPPVVTIVLPANTTYGTLPIVFNVSTSESSVANFSLNNGLTNYTMTSAGGTSFNATNSSIVDGVYVARFFAQDTLGNMNVTANVTFSVGTSAPQVTINLPLNTTYDNSTLVVNVSLNKNGSAQYTLNNGVINITMTGNQGLFGTNFNATNLTLGDGNYLLRVYSNDTFGNRNDSASVNFSIETGLSITSCRILGVENGDYTIQSNISASGSCFNVTVTNISINGNGYYLRGNGSGMGINAKGRNEVTLRNITIVNFSESIDISPNVLTEGGANGGNVTLLNSVVDVIDIRGANGSTVAGNAGHLKIKDSVVKIKVKATGGDFIGVEGDGGNGGEIEFDADIVQATNLTFTARKGLGAGTGSDGNIPLIIMNYSDLLNSSAVFDGLVSLELARRYRGKITWDSVNISGIQNVSQYVDIGGDYISINSSGISVLNTSAAIELYNISGDIAAPAVFKDGVLCNDCFISGNGDIISFTVQSFSNYTIGDVSTGGQRFNVTAENNFTHLNLSDNNLVMYIPFDTNTSISTVYDYSSNSRDAALQGAPTWFNSSQCGIGYGGCFNFSGTNPDYLEVTGWTNTANSNFSVCLWTRPNLAFGAQREMIGNEGSTTTQKGWRITTSVTDQWAFTGFNVSQSTANGGGVVGSRWQHLCGTYNYHTGNMILYVNATSVESLTADLGGYENGQVVRIARTDVGGRNWPGQLDEIMYFNKVLSSAEVSAIYQNTSARFLARGEHFYKNLNVSGNGAENTVNVSITELLHLPSGNENFSVQIGNSTAGDYAYGPVFQINSGVANSIPHGTPNNISIKIIYNADSNSFYTPILQGNVTLNSFETVSAGVSTCQTLSTTGATYTMSANILTTGTCFQVTADDITLDGAGFRIEGNNSPSQYGINATGRANFTLRNINISNFSISIGINAIGLGEISGGNINISNSRFTNLEAFGSNTTTNNAGGGDGGTVVLLNSTAVEINSKAGGPQDPFSLSNISGGDGGNVFLRNSNATKIYVQGERDIGALGPAGTGSGGNIYIENNVLNISFGTYNLSSVPDGSDGGTTGLPGRLTLNYTTRFEAISTDYGNNLSLRIVNGSSSGAEILFHKQINATQLSNLSNYVDLRFNNAFINGSALSALNKTANISLYGTPSTGFITPVIKRDENRCTDCYNLTPLTATTVVLNVTGFSTYKIDENNTAPASPSVFLNSTQGSNRTHETLNCYSTITDPETNGMNVTVWWFNNTVQHLRFDYNNSYASGSLFTADLTAANTTKGENWTCGIRLFDGALYRDQVNSSNLTILNSPPHPPTLDSPSDGFNTTDRTPVFVWNIGSDNDTDTLTYELNLTCYHTAGGGCGGGADNRHVTGLTTGGIQVTHEIVGDLKFLRDNSYYYNWTAVANDGAALSSRATERRINITSIIILTLLNDTIEFGQIGQFGTNDTSDNSPGPFVLENEGNSFLNITTLAGQLWSTQGSSSSFYQFKVANFTLENASFNFAQSVTSYTNMPITEAEEAPMLSIVYLNYTNATDTAEVDINVTTPGNEPAGLRSSSVTFTASLGE